MAFDATFAVMPDEGFHFSLPMYPNCVLAWADTLGAGQVCFFGIGLPGSIEYNVVAEVWGPQFIDTANIKAGDLTAQVVAAANAAIQHFLLGAKSKPAVQHDDPATELALQTALGQYYAFDVGTNQIVQVPFP